MPDPRRSGAPHLESVPTGAEAHRSRRPRPLSGWGQHPVVEGVELLSEDLEEISKDAILSRGLGRAYGDASLPPEGCPGHVAGTPLADRLLAFDPQTGVVRAEAGLSLAALSRIFLPRGWASPVSPGTAFITLGGMVAADVHSKDHHSTGCFGAHVRSLRMRVADGRILDVDERREPELFRATLGGMGLTGHILEVEFSLRRVPSQWIWCESERFPNIEALLPGLVAAGREWPSTVSWLDCTSRGRALGRGIVMRGRWAKPGEAPPEAPRGPLRLGIPFRFPNGLANRYTLGLLNTVWYHKHPAKTQVGFATPTSWYHPLDGIAQWHRVYGSRGFTQYQFVVPADAALLRELLERFQRAGGASWITVLKDSGPAGEGPLSFLQTGVSLALDIPIRRGDETRELIGALNEFVIASGGRVYLAKDAFTTGEEIRAMYPRFEEWDAIRRRFDPQGRLASAQSRRLGIT